MPKPSIPRPPPRRDQGGAPAKSVKSICTTHVDTIDPNETAHAAAQRMLQRGVGSLVVIDDQGQPAGMLTDRDLGLAIAAHSRDPALTRVYELTLERTAPLHEDDLPTMALERMLRERCKRMPVVTKDGRLSGILSAHDVLRWLSVEVQCLTDSITRAEP